MAETGNADMQANPVSSRSCPDAEVWASVCGGLMPREEAEALLTHASKCSHCSMILRQTAAILCDDATPEEEEILGRLSSSGDGWGKRVAGKLQSVAISNADPRAERRARRSWILWPVFTVSLAAGVVSFWIYRADHSVDHLLALAYNQQRRTELRLPGGDPVPLWSPTRGGKAEEPTKLLEARLTAERGLEEHPDSARWHEARAQVNVTAMEPKDALAELQIAQLRDPKLPRIEFDLGTAYFELAEQGGNASDYGFAAEHFSKYLVRVQRRDPIALYDRALCWQRSRVPELARKDLVEALKLEKNEAWRAAIEDQIRSLSGSGQAKEPAALENGQHPQRPARPDDYEGKLHAVLDREFAADATTSPVIRDVADLGRTHGDVWLLDWLRASRRRSSRQADAALAAADRDNGEGKSEEALRLADDAADQYRAARNTAGLLRAEAEEIYSLRRSGHAQTSLDRLTEVEKSRHLARYSWLSAFLILERASCLSQVGRFDEARAEAERAYRLASLAQLPSLAMRARGYVAGFQTSQGFGDEAWRLNVLGLQATAAPGTAVMQRYQFLSDLTMDASLLGLPRTAAALSNAAAQLASSTRNLQIEAYATELEGRDEVAAAEPALAAAAFRRADATLATLAHSASADVYQADWAADRAELALEEGDTHRATASLEKALPTIDASGNLWMAFKYWTGRARIESQAHREAEALTSASRAVACAETTLREMKTGEERRAWEQRAEPAWTSMIQALLSAGRNDEALSEWLWFRAAPEGALQASPDPLHFIQAAENSARRSWPNAVVVVFVRMTDAYVAFVIPESGQSAHAVKIGLGADQLDQIAHTFTMLCADPHIPAANVEALGRQLYDILLAPVIPRTAAEIRVDAPATLGRLPFAALVDYHGDYIGSRTRIVGLPAWWGLGASTPAEQISPASHLLLVDAAATSSVAPRIPAGYDEGAALAAMFRSPEVIIGGHGGSSEIARRLQSASVFHFTGHASKEEGGSGLNLGEVSDAGTATLTPASLNGIRLPHCTLAFLAACSTFGDEPARIEESNALPVAFLRAGATAVIGTRWDVDSAASRILVLNFYSAFLKGNPAAAALQSAQATLRERPEFEHPYYWAGFSLLEQ